MKNFLTILLLLSCFQSYTQNISVKVIDSLSGKPLAYATVVYLNQTKITYTDSAGSFLLPLDSLPATDIVSIEYLGYTTMELPVSKLYNNQVIKLYQQGNMLAPVTVQNCKSYKQYIINKRVGKIKQYVGPGPETKFVLMARYHNNREKEGYVDKVEIWMNNATNDFKVPVRFHWYEWNKQTGMPGKELSDTNMVVYPYQEGWNSFGLPSKHLYFSTDEIVFGLEFIYPVEQVEAFKKLTGMQEKIDWLQNMNNRWSLGLQSVDNEDEASFFIMNNNAISKYSSLNQRRLYRPAVRFTVNVCRD